MKSNFPSYSSYFVLAVLALVPISYASEEDFLRWRSVQVECFDTPQTGRVHVSAEVGGKGIKSLTASAFGKSYVLNSTDVAKISAFPLDSLKVTHEAAMRSGEGHSVYVRLTRLYYDKEQKLRHEEAVVSITKGLGVAVSLRAS